MEEVKCLVCGKPREEVSLLISGNDGRCLCNECIRLYSNLLSNYSWAAEKKVSNDIDTILKPYEIKERLDKKVIGQDKAKVALSIAVYNHELFIYGKLKRYRKSNVLLLGATGVGKTLLVESMAEIVNLPVVICDATTYSEVGYVGNDVNQILEMLYYKADCDIDKMQNGIVFLDEIDKIGASDGTHSYGRDVSGAGVQQALLKLIEGKTVTMDLSEQGIKKSITVDTTNIMFIFSGAFVGLRNELETDESLVNYGMLPEFIGRSNCIIKLNDLSKNDLIRIMKDIDDSLYNMYKDLFRADGIDLIIDGKAFELIAEVALSKKLGARALFSILSNLLGDIRYESIQNKTEKVCISYDYVKNKLKRA